MPKKIKLAEKIEQLRAFHQAEGRAPSYAEMAELFGYKSKNAVYGPVNKLVGLGYLERSNNGSVVLTKKITGSIKLLGSVQAGFPSPADYYVERRLSLDEHLIQHKESTFFMRVAGHSMRGLGIYDGDLLIVDRALPATDGCVVVAVLDGEFTLKQLCYSAQGKVLRAAHPDYPDIVIGDEQDLSIWGVVQWNVHRV